jgi:hypothetical protein
MSEDHRRMESMRTEVGSCRRRRIARAARRAIVAGVATLAACGGSAAPPTPGAPPAPVSAADSAVRASLSSVLQGRGVEAVATLRLADTAGLSPRNAATRACMLERLDQRRLPDTPVADRFVAGILAVYREYWVRTLTSVAPDLAHGGWLLERLNGLAAGEGAARAATLDDLEPVLDSLIGARGYHVLLGVTSPLRELMLWRSETEERYEVALPEGSQPVTVMFMDDFASLGWAGFVTCDRSHSGGWTRPDRLYAVRSAYDTASEAFRVSYLTHEGQHFADNRRFPEIERQDELEYRAKLAELAVARTTLYDLLDAFAGNVSDDRGVPHSYANGRVVRDLAARLFPRSAAAPAWRSAPPGRINAAARALLREDTRQRRSPRSG